MKKHLTILLLLTGSYVCKGQTIVATGGAEYLNVYLLSNGTVKAFSQNTITPALLAYTGVDSIVKVCGGQYTCFTLDQRGRVVELGNEYTSVFQWPVDTTGSEFKDNFYIAALYRSFFTIRGTDSTVWYGGNYEPMHYSNDGTIKPYQLTQPAGSKKFKKLVAGSATNLLNSTLVGLTTDGKLYKWVRNTPTPTDITPFGKTIVDFGMAGQYGILATTSDNLIYGIGLTNGVYIGQTTHSTSWVNITANWPVTMPIKEIGSGYNVIHLIDANDNLFGSGSNTMGDIGNGWEHPLLKDGFRTSGPWNVDIAENGYDLQSPIKVFEGKVKNITSGTTITFFHWLQDMNNNWYSWGRNKAFPLGNGLALGPYAGWGGAGDQATYPNAKDITTAKKVTPLTSSYILVNFAVNDDQPAVVGAGIGQYNITTDTGRLYGIVSQQEFTISSYAWTKISGPSGGAITNASAINTPVTGLQNGTYVYRLTVLNSAGIASYDEVELQVSINYNTTNILRTHTKFKN